MKVFIGLFAMLLPALAAAQPAPAVEVRAAAGGSHYLHADLDYTAPALLVAVRIGTAAFAVEPEFVLASHEQSQTFSGPPETVVTSGRRFQSVGINALWRGHWRVSPFAGGGIGWYSERSRYETENSNQRTAQSLTFGPRAGAQIVGGADVRVTSRIKAFGEMRYEVRSFQDPGGGSVIQGFGGIAVVLR